MVKNKRTISLIGCGRLGLNLGYAFASKGFKIEGVDINENIVNSLNKGKAPFFEPELQNYIDRYKRNFYASSDHGRAIENTDITIILVATPSDTYGKFSNKYVERVLRSLSISLKKSKKPYHLFILSSTVMPESIDKRLIPLVEKYTGRRFGRGFGFTFVPDFVALGSVIHDFLNPDFVLIGEGNRIDGDLTQKIYKRLVVKNTPIVRMSLKEAEITKVALNCYITTKISFANMLSQLCEKIPSTNIDNITNAIGLDKRIGKLYIKGGSPFGGNCFPRDVRAFMAITKKYKTGKGIIHEVQKTNEVQTELILSKILSLYHKDKFQIVTFLGGAFKENTGVVEDSVLIHIAPLLLKRRIRVGVFDKYAQDNIRRIFGDKITYFDSIKESLKYNSIFVVSNRDETFTRINFARGKMKYGVVDCWRMFGGKLNRKVYYRALGMYSKD